MSALTALLHSARYGTTWRGLVAFEPPVPPPAGTHEAAEFVELHKRLASRAARRRQTFTAVDELVGSFAKRSAFSRMDEGSLRVLAAATLRWDPSRGLFELACAREFEAETFRLRHMEGVWNEITRLSSPVRLVSSDPAASDMACLPEIARSLADASITTIAESAIRRVSCNWSGPRRVPRSCARICTNT
jgi:hypothetical protein